MCVEICKSLHSVFMFYTASHTEQGLTLVNILLDISGNCSFYVYRHRLVLKLDMNSVRQIINTGVSNEVAGHKVTSLGNLETFHSQTYTLQGRAASHFRSPAQRHSETSLAGKTSWAEGHSIT